MTFLTIAAVSKRYGPVVALDGVTLHIAAGGRTAVVGPSGSGKTTLLRLLAGFDTPHSGRITMDGRVLADGTSAIPAHRRDIGVVMQDGALFPHLSVADNIAFGLCESASRKTSLVHELSDLVGLERAMLERKPDALSGGQQQRVALARALARRPKLMLLDEPFSALDTGLRASTRKAVAALLQSAGVTTVLVTHDQAEALSFADHVAVMGSGRILQAGPPRELYLRPRSATVATFLGEALILPAALSGGKAHCALGDIEADTPSRAGRADIMLRPEQVSLSLHGPGTACRILDVEFAGATSIATLAIRGLENSPIALRQPSDAGMVAGTVARLAVSGPAHVLEAGGGMPAGEGGLPGIA
ncbi:ABC transporter ATP-binding protein [Candidimonas nitroreducens]|uniref:ABC transporter ATP-binding protein n=1 Tax=Candidimonas nitroreducens TaxID=683354 RepID=A0A225N5X2_9BURK|nr:ABC transporter ATP-binding protein [Candidimonas nitroreducens]OWT66409.1 ABC transporter ATP-binding protein [Candidimonas nitroreducens]